MAFHDTPLAELHPAFRLRKPHLLKGSGVALPAVLNFLFATSSSTLLSLDPLEPLAPLNRTRRASSSLRLSPPPRERQHPQNPHVHVRSRPNSRTFRTRLSTLTSLNHLCLKIGTLPDLLDVDALLRGFNPALRVLGALVLVWTSWRGSSQAVGVDQNEGMGGALGYGV